MWSRAASRTMSAAAALLPLAAATFMVMSASSAAFGTAALPQLPGSDTAGVDGQFELTVGTDGPLFDGAALTPHTVQRRCVPVTLSGDGQVNLDVALERPTSPMAGAVQVRVAMLAGRFFDGGNRCVRDLDGGVELFDGSLAELHAAPSRWADLAADETVTFMVETSMNGEVASGAESGAVEFRWFARSR